MITIKIIDFNEKAIINEPIFPKSRLMGKDFFAVCSVDEIASMKDVFDFDESTILECTDLDESIRYSSFDRYDFISLTYMDLHEHSLCVQEINLYISSHYIIMVTPDHAKGQLSHMVDTVLKAVLDCCGQESQINKALYIICNASISDFSDMLEVLEDNLEELQIQIIHHVDKAHFEEIILYRQLTYTIKKYLRALSYIGMQLLVNENGFIAKSYLHYFRNVDTRLKKLYDFSESLYELSNQLLYSYDSRLTMKTNATVNKLTILTIFFGPLTVITGIYGMNFTYMPELKWSLGYPAVLLLMLGTSAFIYFVLKRKKWL